MKEKSLPKMMILLAFFSVAVFGFLAMGGGHHASIHNCIAAVAGSAPCPDNDPLGYASFHLDFFKTFSSTVDSGLAIFALALLALISWLFAIFGFRTPDVLSVNAASYVVEKSPPDVFHVRLRHWLSFHENSPSFLCGNTA